MTLNAISARMRFNSWHYAPSYFDVANVPEGRGWFTAPRMADIADDSDQHHNGHMHALVRYSIRSPLPIRIDHDVLPGFIDLRLMRQSGEPYREAELMTAIAYKVAERGCRRISPSRLAVIDSFYCINFTHQLEISTGNRRLPTRRSFRPSSAQLSMFEEIAHGRISGRFSFLTFTHCFQRNR